MDREQAFWETQAKRYDRSMLVLGGPMPRAIARTATAVEGRVLELAAGTGLFTVAIAERAAQVVATDYAEAMVEALRARVAGLSNVQVQRADVFALPFPPASFEAVVAANVLHLVPDLERALSAMRAVLRPGGILVVPTYAHDQTLVARAISHVATALGFPAHRRFDRDGLVAAVRRAGFHVRDVEVIPGLFPIVWLEARRVD